MLFPSLRRVGKQTLVFSRSIYKDLGTTKTNHPLDKLFHLISSYPPHGHLQLHNQQAPSIQPNYGMPITPFLGSVFHHLRRRRRILRNPSDRHPHHRLLVAAQGKFGLCQWSLRHLVRNRLPFDVHPLGQLGHMA